MRGGVESPHVDIITEVGSVNLIKTDSEKFTCSFDSTGKAKDVAPVSSTETWYFNDWIWYTDENFVCSFTSNNIKYNQLDHNNGYLYYDSTIVFVNNDPGGWINEAYRTIILDEPATGDLLTFLQANAIKIS